MSQSQHSAPYRGADSKRVKLANAKIYTETPSKEENDREQEIGWFLCILISSAMMVCCGNVIQRLDELIRV